MKMKIMMKIRFSCALALYCLAAAVPAAAQPVDAAVQKERGESRPPRDAAATLPSDRIPLATDTGVAWDMISHRGQMRWDCRAVPSGKFVMNSLCASVPKVDSRWPGTTPPPGWDGIVHND
jgi:hypothetical protein